MPRKPSGLSAEELRERQKKSQREYQERKHRAKEAHPEKLGPFERELRSPTFVVVLPGRKTKIETWPLPEEEVMIEQKPEAKEQPERPAVEPVRQAPEPPERRPIEGEPEFRQVVWDLGTPEESLEAQANAAWARANLKIEWLRREVLMLRAQLKGVEQHSAEARALLRLILRAVRTKL